METINQLSLPARKIMRSFENIKVVAVTEQLDHDGYDEYGSLSDLWDLYLITLEDDTYIFYNYHWEDWFRKEKDIYELYLKMPVMVFRRDHKRYIDIICETPTIDAQFSNFVKVLKEI